MNHNQGDERNTERPAHRVPEMKYPFGAVRQRYGRVQPRLPARFRDNRFRVPVVRGQLSADGSHELRSAEPAESA